MDKFSYAIGLGIGQNLSSMGIQGLAVDDFAQAIRDVLEGNQTAISHNEAREIVNKYAVRRNHFSGTSCAIAQVRWDIQLPFSGRIHQRFERRRKQNQQKRHCLHGRYSNRSANQRRSSVPAMKPAMKLSLLIVLVESPANSS